MQGSIQVEGGPSRSIRIVFHETALIHMQESDQKILKSIFQDAGNKIRPLDQLSSQFKNALLVVAGPSAKNQLGYKDSTASYSRSPLKLSHLSDPITFVLTHVSELPSDTLCMSSICKTGDHIVYDRIESPPFFQSDFRAVKPIGALDFAVPVLARDLVWVDNNLCLASQQYLWECQYLAELRPDILTRLLYGPQVFCIKYEATSNAPFHALEAIAGEASNNEVKLVRHCSALIRPGCGVVVETPLSYLVENSNVAQAFGTVVGFETRAGVDVDVDYVVIQLHLCRDDLPCSVLSRMSPGELIQTNIRVTVPAEWVSGTFRISPALLYTATHITEESDGGLFKDKIVVCDAVVAEPDHMPHSNLGVLARVANGQVHMTLRRMAPFPPECALAFLHHQHAVHCGELVPATPGRNCEVVCFSEDSPALEVNKGYAHQAPTNSRCCAYGAAVPQT